MSEGFIVGTWTAMLFFRACRRYGIQSREDRVLLMRELARRNKAKYVRDVGPLLAGKKVLIVKKKPLHNPYDSHYCPDCGPKEK